MSKFKVMSACSGLILLAVACNTNQIEAPSDDHLIDTAVAATVTSLSSSPTETLDSIQPCPVEFTDPAAPALTSSESFPSQIQDYLNQGGSLDDLGQIMETNQLEPHEGLPYSRQDFTGDGMEDVVISILNGDGAQIAPAGTLLLFVCQDDQYQVAYSSPTSTELAAPFIRAAQDVNADGIPDLLTTREMCGAHTCSFEVNVLTWNEGALRSIFPDVTTDIPLPLVDLEGPQEDGTYEIVITGTGIASVGAGPFRPYSRIWSYDQGTGLFQLSETVQLDTNFRIHIVHDADQAVLDGEYEIALDLYARVINDDSLDDWAAGEEGARTLAAYATYRRLLTLLQLDQFEAARSELNLLTSTYPPETSGFGYAQLGQTLWDEFQATEDLAAACRAAQDYAQTNTQAILDPLYYGYANKTYVASDICPISG